MGRRGVYSFRGALDGGIRGNVGRRSRGGSRLFCSEKIFPESICKSVALTSPANKIITAKAVKILATSFIYAPPKNRITESKLGLTLRYFFVSRIDYQPGGGGGILWRGGGGPP